MVVARLSSTSSRFPPISPAATSVQNRWEKTRGYLVQAAESDDPCSRSNRTSLSTRASSLFSTCEARMLSERTTDRPESTMVESCRVMTATSRSLTRSEIPGILISVLRLTCDFGVTEMGMYPISRSRRMTSAMLSPSSWPSTRLPERSRTL
jgi:hypothetical protein